jgi:hypothetical protein
MFASQSCSKVTNLRIALANTKKLNMSTAVFFAKMQNIADSLAAAGRPVNEEELVSFLLAGLGHDYSGLVEAIGLMTTSISVNELYAQVLAKDERDEMLSGTHGGSFDSSANAAMRRGGYSRPRGGKGPSRTRDDRARDDRARDDRRDERPRYNNKGAAEELLLEVDVATAAAVAEPLLGKT